jgi:hypothetical protein
VLFFVILLIGKEITKGDGFVYISYGSNPNVEDYKEGLSFGKNTLKTTAVLLKQANDPAFKQVSGVLGVIDAGVSGVTSPDALGKVGAAISGADDAVAGGKGIFKVSQTAGKILPKLGKAAPALKAGAAVMKPLAKYLPGVGLAVGNGLGAMDVHNGLKQINKGNSNEGKKQVVGGVCDIITTNAFAVAAAGAVVPPVAIAAGVVAGGAQLVKYGYKHKEQLAQGISNIGKTISSGASKVGKAFADAYANVPPGMMIM